ncbi:MAG: hypothetical protein OEY55_13445 [Acidimicrobiia bacterium]|nr:hypothetical protein [Acidimicrobiia bacterium]
MSDSDSKVLSTPDPFPAKVSEIPSQPGAFRRFFRQLWRLIKIVLVLAILVGIGIAIYYGWPIVKERYLDPIASNSVAAQTAAERLDSADARLTDLETQVATLTEAEAGMPERLTAIESAQQDLDTQVTTMASQIDDHTNRLDDLDMIQAGLTAGLVDANAETVRQVELLRSMELLSRARLFLFQANYGLAKADVQTARTILGDVQTDYPDWEPAVIKEVLFRVDKTIAALPLLPVPASNDLDIAWQVLLTQVVVSPPPVEPTTSPDQSTSTTTTVGSGG